MGYVGGGGNQSSANQWSKEQAEYELVVYKLVRTVLRVFGDQGVFFTGSLAMNTYFGEAERRIVCGVDVVPMFGYGEFGQGFFPDLCDRLNQEFEREDLARDLKLKGTAIRLGFFEALKNTPKGRLRLVALVSGGYMNLKKSCRLVPSGGAKLAYLDGDKNLAELKVSPIFLSIFDDGVFVLDLNAQSQIKALQLSRTVYINDAARAAGYGPLALKVPPLEYFVAAKLNMIYQSSINENVIRATPLATHYAVKNGRPKLSAVDVYDFVVGARLTNPQAVKRALKPMLAEPANAMLDMTNIALGKISNGKQYEELNSFLPANKAVTQEGWKTICSEAMLRLKKIRESP